LPNGLIEIPGVVAVTLWCSRAGGCIHRDSDWDFGLYYRDAIRADDVRALGFEGTVVEPGSWGRRLNGGASLTVGDQRLDLLYRDLDIVRHWVEEAEAGRYEVDQVEGHLAGMASYVLGGGRARRVGVYREGSCPASRVPAGGSRRSWPLLGIARSSSRER
jgi:hypothetical protein